MPNLLTPAELAAIAERAKDLPKESWSEEKLYYLLRHGRKRSGYWDEIDGDLPEEYFANFLVNARADIPALLAHIAALEARTPAPALPADMEALLAEEVQKVAHARKKLRALCNGRESFTMRIPADRTYDHDLAFADAFDVCDNLATALRETLAREQAEHARAEKAEAERKEDHDILREAFNAYAPFEAKGPTDNPIGRAIVVMKFLNDDLAAARKELAGLKGGAQ